MTGKNPAPRLRSRPQKGEDKTAYAGKSRCYGVQVMLNDLEMGLAAIDRNGRIFMANESFYARLANSGLAGNASASEIRKILETKRVGAAYPILERPPEKVIARNGQIYRIVHVTHVDGPLSATIQFQRPFSLDDRDAVHNSGEDGCEGRNTLLAKFAHETRTHLTNVLGFADMMLEDDRALSRAPHIVEWASYIRGSAGAMLDNMNAILEIMQLMEEGNETELEPLKLADVLLESLRAPDCCGEKESLPEVRILGEVNPEVLGEEVQLRKALRLVCRSLHMGVRQGGGIEVELFVTDGEGIIRFIRSPDSETTSTSPADDPEHLEEGVSEVFALPLARAIIERHKGSVVYDEEPDGSAVYVLRLPLA